MKMYDFSPYINENIDFLHRLSKTKSEKKKYTFIKHASSEQILAIVEICANILGARFELNKRQRRKLAQFADYYRAVARSRSEKTARHRIQQGGQAVALSAILAPILGSLVQHVLDRTLLNKTGLLEHYILLPVSLSFSSYISFYTTRFIEQCSVKYVLNK